MRLCYFFLFFAIFNCLNFYSQVKNEGDLKKMAEKQFEENDYHSAYKSYAQLVSLYPKDPFYNYKLAVCMLYIEPDKKKPYSYLQISVKNPVEASTEAMFYLAKTYHINYRFDEAIKYYNEYKKIGSSSTIKKLEVDREIQACKNGKQLLSNLTDLVIINKKQLNEVDYFKAYDVKDIGGKLLVKPDEYKSSYDKKKKEKSVVYLPRSGERLYYSSYGEGGNKGKDLYYVNRLPNGGWSKPQSLPSVINTEFDEDYPFLHPNGKTLYFSSKGHNSMGGYDVFKTTFNQETQLWSKPENLEFPINSPDDDILFVTDSLEKTAYFSTGRYSPYGKLDVLKINTERKPINYAFLKGTVVKEEVSQSLKSKITVKNMSDGEIVGTFQAQDNGDYNMELPNGGKFIFTVETPGFTTQSEGVQIPVAYNLKPYKQIISYENKKLKIINYFDGNVVEENYAVMIDLIEKKARLDVNESEFVNNDDSKNVVKNDEVKSENQTLTSVATNNPTVQSDEIATNQNSNKNNNTNTNVTNEQLLTMAKEDAIDAANQAKELKQEAIDAFGLATQKTAEAIEKEKEADQIIENSKNITDEIVKNEELAKAIKLKEEAKIATNMANIATNIAKKLEVDAERQQKEVEISNQYIAQLETVTKNKNNIEALNKLQEIQKELDQLSKQRNQSDELYASIKAETELKKQELTKIEKQHSTIFNEIKSINDEKQNLENDLASEKDKSIKENIKAQIQELNNDLDEKNKELATNQQKIDGIRSALEGTNQELQVANQFITDRGNEVAVSETANSPNQTQKQITGVTNQTEKLSYETISNKYKQDLNTSSIQSSDKNELIKQNEILNAYKKDLSDAIVAVKNKTSKINDVNEKQRFEKELVELQKLKTEVEERLVVTDRKIKENETSVAITQQSNATENSTTQQTNNTDKQENKSVQSIPSNNNSSSIGDQTALSEKNKVENQTSTSLLNDEKKSNLNKDSAIAEKLSNSLSRDKKLIDERLATANEFKTIDISLTSNPAVLVNELGDLKTGLDAHTESINQLKNYKREDDVYKNEKEEVAKKLELARQNEVKLQNLIASTTKALSNNSEQQHDDLLKEAEKLINQAYTVRKDANGKTDAEKEILLKQAQEIEKSAIYKKTEAAVIAKTKNGIDFENNLNHLTELQALSIEKTDPEVAQANTLINEAFVNFNQAAKIRSETEAYASKAAKLGGLSNAEEKETEALAKQQKALDMLAKINPNYKISATSNAANTSLEVKKLNEEINKTSVLQIDAYSALNRLNEKELKNENDNLIQNPDFKNNQLAKDLKTASDKLKADANEFIRQSSVANSQAEKANLLLKANEYQLEAIKVLNNAKEAVLSPSQIASDTKEPTHTNSVSENEKVKTQNDQNNVSSQEATVLNKNKDTQSGNIQNTNDVSKQTNVSQDTVVANKSLNTTKGNNVIVKSQLDTVKYVSNVENTEAQKTLNEVSKDKNNNSINSETEPQITANKQSTSELKEKQELVENLNPKVSVLEPKKSSEPQIVEETKQLKVALYTEEEIQLLVFNPYTDQEAVTLQERASLKINAALNNDRKIITSLDKVLQLAENNQSTKLDSIHDLTKEIQAMTDEASLLRKTANSKAGVEKENELNKAKVLEASLLSKKVKLATLHLQVSKNTYEENSKHLSILSQMAKEKQIAELNPKNTSSEEPDALFQQAEKLRREASQYKNDAAMLGGYSNAEEKENLALEKQLALFEKYRKHFPDYSFPKPQESSVNPEAKNQFDNAKSKSNNNDQMHIEGLMLLSEANGKEYTSILNKLPQSLSPEQQNLKGNARESYQKYEELKQRAKQAVELDEKKKMLIEANKYAQEAIILLREITKPTGVLASNNKKVQNNNKENVLESTSSVPSKSVNVSNNVNNNISNDAKNNVSNNAITNSSENSNKSIETTNDSNSVADKYNKNESASKVENKQTEVIKKDTKTTTNVVNVSTDSIASSSMSSNQKNEKKTAKEEENLNIKNTSTSENLDVSQSSKKQVIQSTNLKDGQNTQSPTNNDAPNNKDNNVVETGNGAKTSEKTKLVDSQQNNQEVRLSNNTVAKNDTLAERTRNQSEGKIAEENNKFVSADSEEKINLAVEVPKLKKTLNNPEEITIKNFSNYKNNEAIALKEKALAKINKALEIDKQLNIELESLDLGSEKSNNTEKSGNINDAILALTVEIQSLNNDALELRKNAESKSDEGQEADLKEAKNIEANALAKKLKLAKLQQQLNKVSFEANQKSLTELSKMAEAKNISELGGSNTTVNEVNTLFRQAEQIRNEAQGYKNDVAMLGAYSNAEEKEAEALLKQNALLEKYKKQFPDYKLHEVNNQLDEKELVSKFKTTKANAINNNNAHIEGLILLAKANESEYKMLLGKLPKNLNSNQIVLKEKAQNIFKKNQDLITQANQSTEFELKKKYLIDANTQAQEAIQLLNELSNSLGIALNENVGVQNSTVSSNNKASPNKSETSNELSELNRSSVQNNTNANSVSSTSTINATSKVIKQTNLVKINEEGIDVKNTNVYSDEKPIPLDEKIEDGLIFKVQIGAFKTQLPNNTFKGLSPIIAQTAPSGYIRYMAGNFEQYAGANAVKNDLRNLGFKDAFVVAYYNGKRINLNEATNQAKAAGQKIEMTENTSAGLTTKTNVPFNAESTNDMATMTNDTKLPSATIDETNRNNIDSEIVNGELEKMNGLLYTVQIGVFSKQVTRTQLFNLKPIYTEKLPNGLYRYTAGIYIQRERLIEDKRRVIELGVKDAFISAYYNAKRIPFGEGQKLQKENQNLKLEVENPIVFPQSGSNNIAENTTAIANNNVNAVAKVPVASNINNSSGRTLNSNQPNNIPTQAPFSNGIKEGPAPTSENGVKTDFVGISYVVQIGAYKNQVPNAVASKFLNIKTWPIQSLAINGLYIYTIGNFNGLSFAKSLKDEAISLGITDAFITVYKDGKKLYGSEASQYLIK